MNYREFSKNRKNNGGLNNSKKIKITSPTERKSSWRPLHLRFPRIATFAARRIRLRNAAGNAYANPSAHISGIVHSCPHLGYLNYICNAYRDAVGTEYVGFAHALRLRHRRRRRRCHRRGGTTYVYSWVKRSSIYTHALSPTRGLTCVRSRKRACRRSLRTGGSGAIEFELRVCMGLHMHMRTRTQVRACHNTLRPIIALHTSVTCVSLSLPPCKSRCAIVTYIRDSRRVRML